MYAVAASIVTGIERPAGADESPLECKKAEVASLYSEIETWATPRLAFEKSHHLASAALFCSSRVAEPGRAHYAFIAARAQLIVSRSSEDPAEAKGFARLAYSMLTFVKNDTSANRTERLEATKTLILSADYFQSLGIYDVGGS